MADSLQTQRRASLTGVISVFTLPKPPEIPQSMVSRFPELGEYNQSLSRWWVDVVSTLSRSLVAEGSGTK